MKNFPYKTTGIIRYDPPRGSMKSNRPGWCVVDVDKEITRYYREVVSKKFHTRIIEPAWNAHVSVFRGESFLTKHDLWKAYDGQKVEIYYTNNVVQCGNPTGDKRKRFFAVDVRSPFLKKMRDEVGVPSDWNFHLTIGKLPDNYETRELFQNIRTEE